MAPKLYHIILGRVKSLEQRPHRSLGYCGGRHCATIQRMRNTTLQILADRAARETWTVLVNLYPNILFNITPKVILNNRLKTTAGRAFIEHDPQYVDLCTELMEQYTEEFCNVIIPHELAHLAAYTVYNDRGHRKGWKTIMRQLGLEPEVYHNMVNHKRS